MVKIPLDINAQRDDWHVPEWVRVFFEPLRCQCVGNRIFFIQKRAYMPWIPQTKVEHPAVLYKRHANNDFEQLFSDYME